MKSKSSKINEPIKALFKDKTGKYVIFQYPNIPLWIAIVAFVLRIWVKSQPYYNFLDITFNAAILIWAFLEIFWGVNLFRRIFGAVIFLLILFGLIFQ